MRAGGRVIGFDGRVPPLGATPVRTPVSVGATIALLPPIPGPSSEHPLESAAP